MDHPTLLTQNHLMILRDQALAILNKTLKTARSCVFFATLSNLKKNAKNVVKKMGATFPAPSLTHLAISDPEKKKVELCLLSLLNMESPKVSVRLAIG